jgi:hypothetical protein
MLKFNLKALKALPKLFAYRNDIDIYTEDKTADKEFYKALFKRLFKESLSVNDVTPLGCKANVLTAYDTQDKKSIRKRLYIVDGDLDLIIGTNRKAEENLVVLDSYCIENYLVEESAIIELIYYSNGIEGKDTIKSKLNFSNWLSHNHDCLINLFLHYGLLKKFGGGPKVRNANEFLKQDLKQVILDRTKIAAYSESIKAELLTLLTELGYAEPQKTYVEELTRLKTLWPIHQNSFLRIVSGKSYLIPLLQHRVIHCVNKSKSMFNKDSLKLFLANNANLDRLDFVRDSVR